MKEFYGRLVGGPHDLSAIGEIGEIRMRCEEIERQLFGKPFGNPKLGKPLDP